jgi:cytoskeletal protein RodZ
MEQERFVLPKFTVPGQRDWVKWVLLGVGGLVAVNLIAFGVVLSKRSAAQVTAAAQAQARAQAKADELPLVPSATAQPAASKPTLTAAVSAPEAAAPDTAAPSKMAPAARAKNARHARRSHTSHKTLAKASSSGQRSGKPDAIDELLKRFK